MNKRTVSSCVYAVLLVFMVPQTAVAWFAQYFLFDHLHWTSDSQMIVFEGECFSMGNGGCGGDIIFGYEVETERLINLTPEIRWYMMSPSQKWLVFADAHGLYALELNAEGQPHGKPLQVIFHPLFHYHSRWILVGFSLDESTFLYGVDDQYYEVSLPTTFDQEIVTFSITERSDDFSCAEYTTHARYYEARRGKTYRRGQSAPVTDKCVSDDITVNTLYNDLQTFDMNLVPPGTLESHPQQPCVTSSAITAELEQQDILYALQFAIGEESLAYEHLREYAEYLDGLGLRVRLEHDTVQKQFRLRWGYFKTHTEAETAQACVQQQFSIQSDVVEHANSIDEHEEIQIETHPLKSFGRIISPDKTKTAYIKNRWSMSFPDALPELWLIEHGHYYEEYDYKVVDAITN